MLKKWLGAKQSAQAKPEESVDEMRRRAQHRLIGAVVLVALGVVGFPLVFDTNPRPLDVDMPIVIPNPNAVPALALPPADAERSGDGMAPVTAAPPQTDQPNPAGGESGVLLVVPSQPASAQVQAPAPAQEKPEPAKETASDGRWVVQVGSFTDAASVRRVRQRLERAGLKTYTQIIRRNGKRLTRVRLGPFDQQAKANAAAEQARGLGLDTELLRL